MRLFVATDLPLPVIDAISEVRQSLDPDGERARWVRPESMHLTVKFLGHVPRERVETIDRSLKSVRAAAFTVSISSVGFFPNNRSPRVLWIGVFSDGLVRLARNVEEQLATIGCPAEARPFAPHLTLARGPKKGRIQRALVEASEKFLGREWGTFTTDRFCLYESRPQPSGVLYERLWEYPLKLN